MAPPKQKICGRCLKDVGDAPMIMAARKVWHKHHFTCKKCEQNLNGKKYFEEEGEIYCEQDWNTLFKKVPICASCGKNIDSNLINAIGKTWHKDHFVCAHCKKPFKNNVFFPEDGLPYCKEDHQKLFKGKKSDPGESEEQQAAPETDQAPEPATSEKHAGFLEQPAHDSHHHAGSHEHDSHHHSVCGHCELPMPGGTVVTALGKSWHKDCFVCTHCKKVLTEKEFSAHQNQPYCNKDYKHLFGKKCSACGKAIKDVLVTALDKHWHKQCFMCENCKKPISAPQGFTEKEGKAFCLECSQVTLKEEGKK